MSLKFFYLVIVTKKNEKKKKKNVKAVKNLRAVFMCNNVLEKNAESSPKMFLNILEFHLMFFCINPGCNTYIYNNKQLNDR